nr:hypothetical protein [Terriglobales bacterium]
MRTSAPASLFKQPALARESGEIMVGAAHPYPDLLLDEEAPILIFEASGGGTSAKG